MNSINFLKKASALAKQMDQIEQDLNILKPIDLNIVMDMTNPCAGDSGIEIPYLFLIESEDLPPHLRVAEFDDCKLNDDAYLSELRQWTLDFIGINNPDPITESEKYKMKAFALYLRDSVESKNAKTFVLRHEAAHLLHRHNHQDCGSRSFIQPLYNKYSIFATLAAALGSSLSSFFHSTPASWIMPAVSAIYTSAVAMQILARSYRSISREKEADLTAICGCEKARTGGFYLFKTIQHVNLRERNNTLYGKLLFNSLGDNRILNFTHPSNSERIGYMNKE